LKLGNIFENPTPGKAFFAESQKYFFSSKEFCNFALD
jgi:hypothetical protein